MASLLQSVCAVISVSSSNATFLPCLFVVGFNQYLGDECLLYISVFLDYYYYTPAVHIRTCRFKHFVCVCVFCLFVCLFVCVCMQVMEHGVRFGTQLAGGLFIIGWSFVLCSMVFIVLWFFPVKFALTCLPL